MSVVVECETVPIYIVVSQTGTMLSRILKIITRKEYNHASLSLADDLHIMYSFGRRNPYNPFFGGFVRESAYFGTFKRFSGTRVVVLRTMVTKEEFLRIETLISNFVDNPDEYGYNYIGLALAGLRIHFPMDKRYYCSEFVREVLVSSNIQGADRLKPIVHPMNFLKIPEFETIYRGKLSDYGVAN